MPDVIALGGTIIAVGGWVLGARLDRKHYRGGWLISCAVGLSFALLCLPFQIPKDVNFFFGDELMYLWTAVRMAGGELLYRETWEFLQPGFFVLLSWVFRLFGTGVVVLDVCTLAMFAAIAACMHRIVARQVSLPAAWLTVAAFVLLLRPLGVSLFPHWMSTLAALLTMLFLLDEATPAPRVRLLAAGAGFAATFLVQQHKGVYLAGSLGPAYIVACLASGAGVRKTLQAIGWLAVGALLLVGPLLIWLGWHNLWGEWWYATFTWLREGYGPANREAPVFFPLDWSLPLPVILRSLWMSADLTVMRLLPVFYFIAPFTLISRTAQPSRRTLWLVWAGALGVFGTAIFRYEQLRLMYTAPTTLVLAAITLGRLRGLAEQATSPKRWKPIAFAACAVVLCIAAAQQYAAHVKFVEQGQHLVIDSPRGRVHLWSSGWGDLNDIGPVVAVLQAAPRQAGLFVYPGGWGYAYLSGLRNGTPYQFVLPEYTRPLQWERLMAAIDDPARVQYIVWDRTFDATWMRDIVPSLDTDLLWNNSLVARLKGPGWRVLLATPSVTLYERQPVAADAELGETTQIGPQSKTEGLAPAP